MKTFLKYLNESTQEDLAKHIAAIPFSVRKWNSEDDEIEIIIDGKTQIWKFKPRQNGKLREENMRKVNNYYSHSHSVFKTLQQLRNYATFVSEEKASLDSTGVYMGTMVHCPECGQVMNIINQKPGERCMLCGDGIIQGGER